MISLLVLLEKLSVIHLAGSLVQCLARGQCSARVNYSVVHAEYMLTAGSRGTLCSHLELDPFLDLCKLW